MLKKNIICVILVSVFAAIGVLAQSQDPPTEEELKRRIVKREYTDVSDINRWEIKAEYPELRLKGDIISDGFSRAAKSKVMKHVNEFKKQMAEFTDDDRKTLPKQMNYYMSIGYSVEYFGDDLVSINFGRSEFTGGAHPNHWSFTLNYDLKNAREINLTDLFKRNSNYLKVISSNSISQITTKQGEYAGSDWIKQGAGEKLENFKNWNATKKGLKFTFDPYQVGPYAAGSFETIVPYEKFSYEMQSPNFYNVEKISFIKGNPPNMCRNGHFPNQDVDFRIALIKGKKNSRAYFYKDDNDCPNGTNCQRKAYLIAGDEVIYSRAYGDYACVWYQPQKGSETVGWIKKNKLAFADKRVRPVWIGEWEYAENSIKFIPSKIAGRYKIKGDAIWKGLGDNVHIGELDFMGNAKNGRLKAGDGESKYDCQVKMQRIGKYLIVSDNKMCGGVNVSFDGVYLKRR